MLAPRHIISILTLCVCAFAAQAQLSFTGCTDNVISEKPAANTGLDMIYVISDTRGVTATYTAYTDAPVTWMRFSSLGGGYAESIPCTVNGRVSTITLGTDDMGYIIDEGTTRHCYWVVNYANHTARFDALDFSDEQECDRARLVFSGQASHITYYTVNGAPKDLSRELSLSYYSLKYDATSEIYTQVTRTETIDAIDGTFGVVAPLCDTRFTLTGDRFLKDWGRQLSIQSDTYRAIAVEAETSATQEQRTVDNEQSVQANLGGSAPVEITFSAVATDAAIFQEWQMSHDATFETIIDRFQQPEFTYTFRDNGNTFVRFVANNAAGTCEFEGETYEVYVGESDLLCPNVFSPNGDGVNDEWKVSYKSIVEFECHIFNQWGQEVCSFTDPSQGWDGKYHGKYVPTGVYYYVIRAKGSDGRKYKLDGDINILKAKKNPNVGSAPEE